MQLSGYFPQETHAGNGAKGPQVVDRLFAAEHEWAFWKESVSFGDWSVTQVPRMGDRIPVSTA